MLMVDTRNKSLWVSFNSCWMRFFGDFVLVGTFIFKKTLVSIAPFKHH